ncbi:hypothetical protein AAU61_06115 [Desulfocarbo indianensis]|nr:hypothetical protein AAU61_06115 [Desulfocarbo indianensis]
MLYIHPIMQFILTLLSIYVLYLGIGRFRSLHLGQGTAFARKRHILLGKIVLAGWLLGMAGGVYMTKTFWHGNFITGDHAVLAAVMAPLMAWGLISGLYLEFSRRKRVLFPLLHGLANAVCVVLALWQIWEGWQVLQAFVWGL